MSRRLLLLATCAVIGCAASSTAPQQHPLMTLPPAPTASAVTPSPRATPDAPFRAAAPLLAAAEPFTPPAIQDLKLTNGLRVLFLEQHMPALLRVEVVLNTGSTDYATVSMIGPGLWLGAGKRTEGNLVSALSADLAQNWYQALPGDLETGISGPSDRAASMISLLADVVLHPTFPANAVLRANIQRVHELELMDGNAPAIAARVLPMALCGCDHPETDVTSLRAADVGALTRDDIAHAYEAALEPSQATVVVVGDTTVVALLPMLEQAFGTWKNRGKRPLGKNSTLRGEAARPAPSSPRLVVVDRPQSKESSVLVGGAGPAFVSPDWTPAIVMQAIFSGPGGRATRSLRDERHLAFDPSLRLVYRPARTLWSGELPTQRTGEGLREIDRLMRAMKDSDVTPTELDETRERFARLDGEWLSTLQQEVSVLNGLAFEHLPVETLAKEAARRNAVTAADVRRVAAAYLDPDRMKVVVVGDWAKLRAQLVDLGWGPIELRTAAGAVVSVERGDAK